MIGESPICLRCKHYHADDFNGFTCDAFSDGIPDEIIINGNKHTRPLSGQDNDIIFEKIEEK
jgi:hypothetical protein